MNMAWITPETNWKPGDGIKASDLNRIEGNIESLVQTVEDVARDAEAIVARAINTFTLSGGKIVQYATPSYPSIMIKNVVIGERHVIKVPNGKRLYVVGGGIIIPSWTGSATKVTLQILNNNAAAYEREYPNDTGLVSFAEIPIDIGNNGGLYQFSLEFQRVIRLFYKWYRYGESNPGLMAEKHSGEIVIYYKSIRFML
jgi:hypothetical protein